jgi:hypothetical protein
MLRREAGRGVGHAELGRLGGDCEIGVAHEAHARARGHSIHGGDDRRIHAREDRERLVEGARELLDESGNPFGGLRHAPQVAAGAEHAAGAGQEHGPDSRVLVAPLRHLQQLLGHFEVEGVGGLGPIQREVADPIASLEGERFVAHDVVSPSSGRSFGGEAQLGLRQKR